MIRCLRAQFRDVGGGRPPFHGDARRGERGAISPLSLSAILLSLGCALFYGLIVSAALTLPPGCATPLPLSQNGASQESAAVQDDGAGDPAAGIEAARAPDECSELREGPPRGLACLHCMEPGARASADAIVDLLRRSCRRTIAINYLLDGSFGFDESLLREHIETLTEGGRQLFLEIYLLNGPGQRRYQSLRYRGVHANTAPHEFRELLRSNDPATAERLTKHTESLVDVLRYAESRGAMVLVVPMLEDNLDRESFTALLDIVMSAIPPDIPVSFGRNPCAGCTEGADSDVPDGLFRETHDALTTRIPVAGVVSNDGHDYCLGQDCGEDEIPFPALMDAARRAGARDSVFILWSAAGQGLAGEGNELTFRRPEERSYAVPSVEEKSLIMGFLRD